MATEIIQEQADLYISDTIIDNEHHTYDPETGVDNRITSFIYGQTYKLVVSGGSGTGALRYKTKSLTGKGIITDLGALVFTSPGTIQVHIYKESSTVGQTTYMQSNTLVVELTLNQRQVTVKVTPDVVSLDIQETSIVTPAEYGFSYTTEGLIGGSSLWTTPTIYFINHSYSDFYTFDVFSKANSESEYNNGVRYIKNNNGSWSVEGTATSESIYKLINSPLELPDYIVAGRRYQLNMYPGAVPLQIIQYNGNQIIDDPTYESSEPDYNLMRYIDIDEDATGIVIQFIITEGTTIDATVTYHLRDINDPERKIDPTHVGEYSVAAKGAVVPDTTTYDPKIKYRSSKLAFVNTQPYRIYTNLDGESTGSGTIVVQRSALPYETVTFIVSVSTKSSYIESITVSGTTIETRVDEHYNNDGTKWIIRSTCTFEMPIGDVQITYKISGNIQSIVGPGAILHYTDIAGHIVDTYDNYTDALKYCLYARAALFDEYGENISQLMSGVGSYYYFYEHTGGTTVYNLRRKDMIAVLRRISHVKEYPSLSTDSGAQNNPDVSYQAQAKAENAPLARMFTYAGYPPVPDSNFTGGGTAVKYTNTETVFTALALNSYIQTLPTAALMLNKANDDYLENFKSFAPIAWGAYIGAVNGYDRYSYGPQDFTTFQEAVTALWRYAKFRQFPVAVTGTYAYQSDSDSASWAKNAVYWAVDKKITPTRRVDGSSWSSDYTDLLDRAEFAYMVYKFCTLYAW